MDSAGNFLKMGGAIYFGDGVLQHVGIYDEEGHVIHVTGNVKTAGGALNESLQAVTGLVNAEVKRETLQVAANGRRFYIRLNSLPDLEPFPEEEIVRRARKFIGEKFDYTLFNSNCEHFVNWCRYGV